MLSLIWKDIMVQKHEKTLWVALVIALLNTYVLQTRIAVTLMTLIMTVYLLVVYANAFDYKYNGDILVNSLPVGRSIVVTAKYVSVYLYYAAAVVATLVFGLVFRSLHLPTIDKVIGVNLAVLGLFLLSVYYSVFFPLYFKLGYMKSRWVNYLALLVMFVIAGGIYSLVGSEMVEQTPSLDLLIGVLAGNAGLESNLVLVAAAGILIGISYAISQGIYANKEF